MSNPNDPDYWPRYAVLANALKLDHKVAQLHGVADIPTSLWSVETILRVALETLGREAEPERK